jgi:Uma2 family endonuclease
MSLAAAKRLTYAECLAAEAASDTKHEYVAGVVVAISGGTLEHARLIGRLTGLLTRALEGRSFVVLLSDARVRICAADRAVYPDLRTVCGEIQRDAEDDPAVVNPIVIVEVLSDSTAESDRGDRFAAYRRLRSLREHVLLSPHERRVDGSEIPNAVSLSRSPPREALLQRASRQNPVPRAVRA